MDRLADGLADDRNDLDHVASRPEGQRYQAAPAQGKGCRDG